MDDFMCNVLIMGKTGTGKSTLLNYLCETDFAQTGTGKPVTEEGIYDYVAKIKGQEIRIFDSWGIEAGKVERWKELIKKALKQHGVQCSIADWFHSVIYCVQAGGGRVEDVDVEIIRQFLEEGYKVTIVLTKADQVDEDDESQMRKVIINEVTGGKGSDNLNVIATCAQQKKTRSGMTEPFGRDEVCRAILDGWRDTVTARLPKHVVARICEVIEGRMKVIKQDSLPKVQGLAQNNAQLYDAVEDKIGLATEDLNSKIIPQILNEAAAMCHKADMQLSVLFDAPDVTIDTRPVGSNLPMTAPTKTNPWAKAAIYGVTMFLGGLIGVGIVAGIRKLRSNRKEREYQQAMLQANNSQENIQQQQLELEARIDEKTEEICEVYKSQEDELSQRLMNAIK